MHGVLLLGLALSTGCIRELSVSRATGVTMTNAVADQVFGEMNRVLDLSDGPGDFPCLTGFRGQIPDDQARDLAFVRLGNVTTFGSPTTIDSSADFQAVINRPGYVKVVQAINFCGSARPNIIGCSPRPGPSFAVVRRSNLAIEGALWAHEFGHSVGLTHRSDSTAVMNPTILTTTRRVTQNECAVFATFIDGANPATAEDSPEPPVEEALPPAGISIEELARGVWVHGTPFVTPDLFTAGDVDTLVAMLADPAERAHRGNVVALIGMLGELRDAPLLMDLVSRASADVTSWDDARELTAALMGLGYLAQRTGNAGIVEFLRGASTQAFWSLESQELGAQLRLGAAIGLGLSGQPEAWSQLVALRSDPAEGWMASALDETMSAHRAIAAGGLNAYYAQR